MYDLTPLVVRLVGPAASGKTTLARRTIEACSDLRVGLIEANPPDAATGIETLAGGTVAIDASAHWRKGFRNAVEQMRDVDVILVEDRDQTPGAGIGLGEDVQVVVAPADVLGAIELPTLRDAQVLIITKADLYDDYDEAAAPAGPLAANPRLVVLTVRPGDADGGFLAWRRWLEARLLTHRG